MTPRMTSPVMVVPDALQGLLDVSNALAKVGLPKQTLDLVALRASQINGCAVCMHMHSRDLKKAGQSDDRLSTLAAWRDAPYFDDAERAVLALTEAVTRLSDRADPVPDEVWQEVAAHYDEKQLGAVVLAIGLVNLWNRVNHSTKQVPGADWS
jgi:AhpD family alkylhydroperoxidase